LSTINDNAKINAQKQEMDKWRYTFFAHVDNFFRKWGKKVTRNIFFSRKKEKKHTTYFEWTKRYPCINSSNENLFFQNFQFQGWAFKCDSWTFKSQSPKINNQCERLTFTCESPQNIKTISFISKWWKAWDHETKYYVETKDSWKHKHIT
jgi:hypothetical protein